MRSHYEGFEKEQTFHMILEQALDDCATIKARTIKRIIYHVAPDFLHGLFISRPCVRKLRYVGCGNICCEFPISESMHDFVVGKEYISESFNGAVYKIEGRDRPIGAAFFKRID